MNEPYIILEGVAKTYGSGPASTYALRDATFEVDAGELCVIVGPSGAGKTTLLNILGGLDSATGGTVYVAGRNIASLSERELTLYRRQAVGFVFQFYNLVSSLTVLENVELAAQIVEHPLEPRGVIDAVGLTQRLKHFPAQLSGGEQQRVAIARALVKYPKLLLCDEPTGALDGDTGRLILTLLQNVSRRWNVAVVIITHNMAITTMADKVVSMHNGAVVQVDYNPNPVPAEYLEL